jgi:hypothetical protein
MAGLSLASPAIRSCFVDTLSGFKAPSCFSVTALFYNGAPLPSVGSASSSVPRHLQYYQSTKTSGAYPLIYSLARSNFASPSSLPRSGDLRVGPVPLTAAAPSAIPKLVDTGSPRFLGNPSHTFAPLSDPGRSELVSP